MTIDQLMILVTGVPALWLTQCGPKAQRYAPLFGLAGQPFWFYSAWEAGQWGTFFLCCLYALAWGKGVWKHWVKPWLIRDTWTCCNGAGCEACGPRCPWCAQYDGDHSVDCPEQRRVVIQLESD